MSEPGPVGEMGPPKPDPPQPIKRDGWAVIKFHVAGGPKAKGSVSGFPVKRKKTGKWGVNIVHPNSEWGRAVGQAALAVLRQAGINEPFQCPVALKLIYWMPRPKSVSVKKREFPSVRPDIDKLERAVLDGFTHVVYRDDAQVVEVWHRKMYATPLNPVGVEVEIKVPQEIAP